MSEKSGRNFSGAFLSLIAVVISIAALTVSVLEVSAIREQQRASVWPYLEVTKGYSSEGFDITVSNRGIGPALITEAAFSYDGDEIRTSSELNRLIVETVGRDRAFSYDTYKMSEPRRIVLSPGDTITLFAVPWTEDTRLFVNGVGERLSASGCYCSVYEDCWTASLDVAPEPVKACPAS